jgi:hypothetical protein
MNQMVSILVVKELYMITPQISMLMPVFARIFLENSRCSRLHIFLMSTEKELPSSRNS